MTKTDPTDLNSQLLLKLSCILCIAPLTSETEMEEQVRQGLSTYTVAELVARGFTRREVDWIILPHKLALLQAIQAPLGPDESRRALQMARLLALATLATGGEPDGALVWLRRPRYGYSGLSPIDLCKSESGVQHVEDLLCQIYKARLGS